MEKKQTKPIIEFNDYISEQRNDFINYNLILATNNTIYFCIQTVGCARRIFLVTINSSFL